MQENLLDYIQGRWRGQNEEFVVSLSDATLRKHLNAYLESQGICTFTYAELEQMVRRIREQQYQALLRFRQLDYWLTCGDSEVLIQPLTREAYMKMRGGK